ncbi:MAG: DUF6924 domain-containing protein [Jatrophihabitans sp.]
MVMLPSSYSSLLVRTDFGSEDRWLEVSEQALAANELGFQAYVRPVSNRDFDGASWHTVAAAIPPTDQGAAVLFIADQTTLASPELPILVIDILVDAAEDHPPFRCLPAHLWSVENNLNVFNLDWHDFAANLSPDGVFRGFPS